MIINKDIKCTGCGMCEVVCKQGAIKIKMSDEGYYIPFANNDKCNECGLCEKVCPAYKKVVFKNEHIEAFSAFSKNTNTREESTSGGIAYEISKMLISKSYNVCGVKYDRENDNAVHGITNIESELSEFKGSKYIQSYTVNAFKEIVQNLRTQKYVIFGTPCQIAAIDKYATLIGKRSNLILVDFFCHGTPSFYLWKSYIDEVKGKIEVKKINEVNFRSKKYGWHSYTISINTEKGTIYSDKLRDKDFFYEFFLGNHCLNAACYSCIFRAINSKADIRIGDLWGAKFANDKEGVSGILAFTEIGRKVVENLSDACNISSEDKETVIEGQIKTDIKPTYIRNKVIKDLSKGRKLKYSYYFRIIPFKFKRKISIIMNKILWRVK